ncbi:hypothetical protein [Marinospirillum perlucidum]|uniref:hypothetical protein n=1 Tax=Marinospirillum perlucidum TaxID=1982602 RepID=UPI000DF3E46A|nr:hypothetical protein [Marinospirillum perlucidum]
MDLLALDDINNSLKDAAILYGIARSLNAAVSVLQTLEIDAIIGSLAIGEVLDPFNDIIERFSQVMTTALASLAAQKVLMVLVSNQFFNLLLTLSYGLYLLIHLFSARLAPGFFRVFLVFAFIRASFALVVMVNALVDAAFIQQQEAEHREKSLALEEQITSNASALQADQAEFEQLLSEMDQQITALQAEQLSTRSRLDTLTTEKQALTNQLDEHLRSRGVLQRFNPLREPAPLETLLEEALTRLENQEQLARQQLRRQQQEQLALEERQECLATRQEGGSCTLGEWLAKKTDITGIKEEVSNTLAALDSAFESLIYLMAITLLKSLLLPLLFWFLLYRGLKKIWSLKLVFSQASTSGRSKTKPAAPKHAH